VLRVLIVEDEVLLAETLEGIVQDAGYRVAARVDSATPALRALRRLDVDVALVDIDLGEGPDGLAVASYAKRRGAVVVFVTASRAPEVVARTANLGDFVAKPVSEAAILAMLARARERIRAETARRPDLDRLTPGERRVCSTLRTVDGVRSAASALGLQEQTIRNHLKSITAKLGVKGQRELALLLADDARLERPNVLVLEDERLVADDIARSLREIAMAPAVAPDTDQAVELLRSMVFDAAVLDVNVGGGLEALIVRLRDLDVPFLFVSGAAGPPPFAANAVFLSKPVPPRLLQDEVSRLVR
jgi:DNA-binding response OmpR family regulator